MINTETDLGYKIDPVFDGKFHHFSVGGSKKPLWCVGEEWTYKGNVYRVLQYGDFRTGSKFSWASYNLKDQTPAFRKEHNHQMGKIEEESKREREEKRDAGIKKWKPRYYGCAVGGNVSEYLSAKGITGNFVGRVDYRNTLLIPIESLDSDGALVFEGVQMIFREPDHGKWVKFFNEGVNIIGSFCRISDFNIKTTEIIYLCEGYATACSVFMATGVPTICCFNSGNINGAIENLKRLNVDIKIIICADDDFQTVIAGKLVNVGILAAIKACKKFQNVTYRKPIFKHRVSETDFNDLHILEGLEVVREQLVINVSEFVDIVLMGHVNHELFYYLSTQSKDIVGIRAYQHDGKFLKALASEKYWGDKYGKNEKGDPDWQLISDKLLDRQREIGHFDVKKMRGVGVFEDAGRVFVNTGGGVYRADKKVMMSNIDPHLASKNFYKSVNDDVVNFDDELTDEESLKIIQAFQFLRLKNPYDYFYLCGWVAVANVFGALDWRPHLWLTGPAGQGKSWILKKVQDLIHFKKAIKDSTAAGIKQALGANSLAVIYDEAEPSANMKGVIDLARQCSTRNGDLILRGTVGGNVLSYEGSACFLMGSVNQPTMSKADDSRFFVVNMGGLVGQTNEEVIELERRFAEIADFGKRLMVRMVNNFGNLIKNIELSKKWLRDSGINSREADQISIIFGGFFALESRGIMEREHFDEIMKVLKIGESEYLERNESDTSGDDVYLGLLNTVLDFRNGENVRQYLMKAVNAIDTNELDMHGIEVIKGGEAFFVSAKNTNLDKKMKDICDGDFRTLLKRSQWFVESSKRKSIKLFNGSQRRGIVLKMPVG